MAKLRLCKQGKIHKSSKYSSFAINKKLKDFIVFHMRQKLLKILSIFNFMLIKMFSFLIMNFTQPENIVIFSSFSIISAFYFYFLEYTRRSSGFTIKNRSTQKLDILSKRFSLNLMVWYIDRDFEWGVR